MIAKLVRGQSKAQRNSRLRGSVAVALMTIVAATASLFDGGLFPPSAVAFFATSASVFLCVDAYMLALIKEIYAESSQSK